MTKTHAPGSPDVREFETTVESIEGREVTLEETYFYPEGGGQPADRGTIDGLEVADVETRDGTVVHTLESEPAFSPGDEVDCTIDDAFRTYCMRAHTASHVVYGAGRRLFDDLGYAGFDIGPEKVRVDLTTAEPIDDSALVELGRLANRAVWDARPVTWKRLAADEARDLDGIAFNEKTEAEAMSTADREIRVVTVGSTTIEGLETGDGNEPWDVAACGGTHVDNTRRIGPIRVLDRSNPGEGVTRVEFAVGPSAIDRTARVQAATRRASQQAGVPPTELPDAVDRMQDERDTLEGELEDLRREILDARLTELPTVQRDGATWAVGTLERFDPNAVSEAAQEAIDDPGRPDVVATVGTDGAPSVVIASTGAVDAGEVIDDVTDAFGGGGGGGPTVAQGGGLDADPDEVVEWLREDGG
ncbi:alanyl-tRNA editing protein [Natrarchaeobaculum aegyptiacum]|uniref:Alanyl-transfer RNA synthetases family profile domain-containing protein n=1 Tax=Natrarchaeobaculum aegyptiacum TaxID=745377 RepID=A0A2Z2I2M4_9EURY|nr:DHHA1 domain-containing protein [Natrarchaeobaculum aegyptiacum]ARS91188.1 hypothetical protein B1756_16615 [Natrarchaeobaculum aegyptiacum]